MQGLPDEQRMDALEEKIDHGFAEMRSEFKVVRSEILSAERGLRSEIISARSDARADFRTSVALVFGLWGAAVLAVVALVLNHG
jgi:hypothetical protein